mmetsp:Transcript_5362/g.16176  ORF Transcript_5362/g.16176 Transcript_5362/m.16176 type:complete len:269 (-) Transcript_5362:773-1579(-)
MSTQPLLPVRLHYVPLVPRVVQEDLPGLPAPGPDVPLEVPRVLVRQLSALLHKLLQTQRVSLTLQSAKIGRLQNPLEHGPLPRRSAEDEAELPAAQEPRRPRPILGHQHVLLSPEHAEKPGQVLGVIKALVNLRNLQGPAALRGEREETDVLDLADLRRARHPPATRHPVRGDQLTPVPVQRSQLDGPQLVPDEEDVASRENREAEHGKREPELGRDGLYGVGHAEGQAQTQGVGNHVLRLALCRDIRHVVGKGELLVEGGLGRERDR